MNEDEIKAEARLYALECVVCQLAATILLQSEDLDALEALEQMRTQWIAGARRKAFPELADSAMSDLYSAELEAFVDRLSAMQKELLEGLLRSLRNP